MNYEEKYNAIMNAINVLSFIIGVQNMELNDKQVQALDEHLVKQDEQYEKIIQLLEKQNILKKGD